MIGRIVLGLLALIAAPVRARPDGPAVAPVLVVQGPLPPMEAIFAWSPDSRVLLSASGVTHVLQVWDTSDGNLIQSIDLGNLPTPLIYSADLGISTDKRIVTLRMEKDTGPCVTVTVDLHFPLTAHDAETPHRRDCVHPSGERRPPSPAGYRLVADAAGESIVAPGRPPVRLAGARGRELVDLAVTPDGMRAVLVQSERAALLDGIANSVAEVWSLESQTRLSRLRVAGAYVTVRWLDGGRFALIGDANRGIALPPALVVDAPSGRIVDRVQFRCATVPYGTTGAMIAGRTSRCLPGEEEGAGIATHGLWVRAADRPWRPVAVPGLGAPVVEAVAATAGRTKAAFLTRRTIGYEHPSAADPGRLLTKQTRAVLIEGDLLGQGARARTLPVRWLSDNERAASLRFTPDGSRLVIATDARIIVVSLSDGQQTSFNRAISKEENVIAVSDAVAITSSWDRNQANGYHFDGRMTGWGNALRSVMSAGFLANGLHWTATYDGSLRFYRGDWLDVIDLTSLGAVGFVANDIYGRYDSPLGPDSNPFRWWFEDEPLRSLSGQTFMRDYLQPALFTKTLTCTAANDCDTALPPPPPVGGLNRTLPDVRITAVRPGPTRDTAIVEVAARSIDRPTPNGKTRSRMYNLRVFRDGKLVGQWPAAPSDTTALDLDGWRRANVLRPGADGVFRHSFAIRLPTGLDARHVGLTAYAFNDDRVKSDSARAGYDRPWVWPATHKAYILTVGIDDYAEDRFHLDYAVADADLLAKRLATVPGYAVRRLDLRGKGAKRQATGQSIADAIALLAPGDHAAARARLRALGVDVSGFAAATPDDLVVVTYAGHGWADRQGNFYLVPSDEQWAEGQDLPDLTRLISAAQLSDWLRPVDAGDAALIIDACNSAAVVATAGFKPGPLGDRGLGQLAYDKGILILAASQTDQKAHEDAKLGHGFLTAALARDGLAGDGFGRADLNDDGRITLDEWLRYAVARLPSLSAEVASAGRGRDFVSLDVDSAVPPAAPQQPSLFDFAGGPSRVIVGRETWPARARRFGGTVAGRGRTAGNALNEARHVVTDTLYGIMAAVAAGVLLVAVLLGHWLWRTLRRRIATVPN